MATNITQERRWTTERERPRINRALTVGGVILGLALIVGIISLPDIIRYLKIERM